MFWLVHSDLHECKASAALEYMSSMVATLEPWTHSSDGHDQNSRGGKFNVRFKRRNRRVKVTVSSVCVCLCVCLCVCSDCVCDVLIYYSHQPITLQ